MSVGAAFTMRWRRHMKSIRVFMHCEVHVKCDARKFYRGMFLKIKQKRFSLFSFEIYFVLFNFSATHLLIHWLIPFCDFINLEHCGIGIPSFSSEHMLFWFILFDQSKVNAIKSSTFFLCELEMHQNYDVGYSMSITHSYSNILSYIISYQVHGYNDWIRSN